MQTSLAVRPEVRSRGRSDIVYSKGFYAFLCGAVLIGALLGTVSYCVSGESFIESLGSFQKSFIERRSGMEVSRVLVSSLASSSLLLAAEFLLGMCAVGQPFELAVPVFRGMGLGLTLAQLYAAYGSGKMLFSMGLILPSGIITALVLIAGARESLALSCVYFKLTLSDRQEKGLAESFKLYAAKFMVLEAALALAAAVDCITSYFLIGYF